MEKNINPLGAAGLLLLQNLICEMLSICTSEERRELYKGLSKVSNRGSLGAIFNALYKGSETSDDRRSASRITAALSIPACVVVNNLLAKRKGSSD